VNPARLQENLVDGAFWLLEGSPWSLQSLWDEG